MVTIHAFQIVCHFPSTLDRFLDDFDDHVDFYFWSIITIL